MGLFQNEIHIVEKLNNKPGDVKFKSLNGYDAIG